MNLNKCLLANIWTGHVQWVLWESFNPTLFGKWRCLFSQCGHIDPRSIINRTHGTIYQGHRWPCCHTQAASLLYFSHWRINVWISCTVLICLLLSVCVCILARCVLSNQVLFGPAAVLCPAPSPSSTSLRTLSAPKRSSPTSTRLRLRSATTQNGCRAPLRSVPLMAWREHSPSWQIRWVSGLLDVQMD